MGERLLRAAAEHAPDVATVSGIWDAAPSALERIGAAVPGVPRAGSAEAVMDAADCVYIATPPASHLLYAGQALAAGKAVFLEKPLAVDLGEAEAFVRRYDGARIAVNFPFASSLAVQRLQSWIEEGVLGAPGSLDISVAFATWPRSWQHGAASWLAGRDEGGFTREVVSHFLFLSRRLLGPLRLISSKAEYEGTGTERLIEARLAAGAVRTRLRGSVGETDRDDTNSWTLAGVGAIRLRDWSVAERQRPDGTWVPDQDAMPNEKARPLVLRRQLEQVRSMTGGGPHRLARLDEAFEVQSIVESILRGT